MYFFKKCSDKLLECYVQFQNGVEFGCEYRKLKVDNMNHLKLEMISKMVDKDFSPLERIGFIFGNLGKN